MAGSAQCLSDLAPPGPTAFALLWADAGVAAPNLFFGDNSRDGCVGSDICLGVRGIGPRRRCVGLWLRQGRLAQADGLAAADVWGCGFGYCGGDGVALLTALHSAGGGVVLTRLWWCDGRWFLCTSSMGGLPMATRGESLALALARADDDDACGRHTPSWRRHHLRAYALLFHTKGKPLFQVFGADDGGTPVFTVLHGGIVLELSWLEGSIDALCGDAREAFLD